MRRLQIMLCAAILCLTVRTAHTQAHTQAHPSGSMQVAERRAYMDAMAQTTPQAKAAALEAYLVAYPHSVAKVAALETLVTAYSSISDAKSLDAADRLLRVDPANLQALIKEVYYSRKAADALTTAAEKQAVLNVMLPFARKGATIAKPAPMSDADYKAGVALFNSVIGEDALSKKDMRTAIAAFGKEFAAAPPASTRQPGALLNDTYYLAVAYYQSTPPDYFNCAFYAARAAAFLSDTAKPQALSVAKYCYAKYHGGNDGYDAVTTVATANLNPPAGFHIKPAPSPAEIVARVIAATPDLASLSLADKVYMLQYGKAADAAKVWAAIKGKSVQVPGATVIESSPTVLKVAVTDTAVQSKTADFTFEVRPNGAPVAVGSKVTIVGTFRSFASHPIGITMADGSVVSQQGTAPQAADLAALQKRADANDAAAQDEVGKRYYSGSGVPQNFGTAMSWFMRAADLGNAEAQNYLGVMYFSGQGPAPQDYGQALIWFRKSADQGFAAGQYDLGSMYDKGQGTSQDYDQAVTWYRKAVDQGLAVGQDTLGNMFYTGRGVSQDYGQALVLLRKAADQGNADAQNTLGVMYAGGQGIPQDYVQAMTWYRKAADQGFAAGQYDLGNAYYGGQGVPQDAAEARRWYQLAANQGFQQAKDALAKLDAPAPVQVAQNNAANANAALEAEQRREAAQQRQDQIDDVQNDINNLQSDMEISQKGASDMKEACGGGMFQAICDAKSAKYQREADSDQEQIRQKQQQLEELGGASAATAGGSDSSASGGGGSYSGPNSIDVQGLLGRSPSRWSCPKSRTEAPTTTPIQPSSLPCMRDQYVWAALLQAYGAECHAELGMESEAEQNASSMAQNLRAAKSMCSNSPAVAGGNSCTTLQLYPCN